MPPVTRERPLSLTTPLGKDVLLLTGFSGREEISRLFSFELELVAPNEQKIPFDALVGQPFSVSLAGRGNAPGRIFSGICSRFGQGARGPAFTSYRAEIVPWLWLLTRRAGSRIFQEKSVPDILRQVLQGGAVEFDLQGTYPARNYCVQYRETDFDFASRLMEEEGIYYFFQHAPDGHKLVVADSSTSSADLPGQSTVVFDSADRFNPSVFAWEKTQKLRSGKVTLWDHCFELPHQHLEAQSTIMASVQVGAVTHTLKVAGNGMLELYDYPGAYAKRFDGVDPGGGSQPSDLQNIFSDGPRTAAVRMQEEALPSIEIAGASTCRHFASGHSFSFQRSFDADGAYVIASVEHRARLGGDVRHAGENHIEYGNTFTCIPKALPFRPARKTPKAFVAGTQTAVVVGPAGEEIFTDKYGRVKVQFHWDRQGRSDANSSCWIRVGALHAGLEGSQGFVAVPRIGQEVIVDFLEGDPDQPIIVGSVWNAEHLPPPAGNA